VAYRSGADSARMAAACPHEDEYFVEIEPNASREVVEQLIFQVKMMGGTVGLISQNLSVASPQEKFGFSAHMARDEAEMVRMTRHVLSVVTTSPEDTFGDTSSGTRDRKNDDSSSTRGSENRAHGDSNGDYLIERVTQTSLKVSKGAALFGRLRWRRLLFDCAQSAWSRRRSYERAGCIGCHAMVRVIFRRTPWG